MPDADEAADHHRPVYTRTGDDGTTGLLFGGRVRKDAPEPTAYGEVDEAQAAMGVARATLGDDDPELAGVLARAERDLWVLMAELATLAANRSKLEPGATLVTMEMVGELERVIDDRAGRFEPPTQFVVPGGDPVSAQLDMARTVVRRAERRALAVAAGDSLVVPYLNRLSDLLWTLARHREGSSLEARDV
ncbi:MAG: cob(I)yrinic acid a,c-diamide adenosyltransferase [Acidimicrobiales bacterium]